MPNNSIDPISDRVMTLIESKKIRMQPKWLVVCGSVAMTLGFIALAIAMVYFSSIVSFALRSHGPMGAFRFQQLVAGFPWWAIGGAIVGMILGYWLLRKTDFSYKRFFYPFLLIGILLLFLIGWWTDVAGWNRGWMSGSHMPGGLRGGGMGGGIYSSVYR